MRVRKNKVFTYLKTILAVIHTKYSNTINIVFLIIMYRIVKVEVYSVFICVYCRIKRSFFPIKVEFYSESKDVRWKIVLTNSTFCDKIMNKTNR